MTPTNQLALIAGSSALALQALESFIGFLRCVHHGYFGTARARLEHVELKADQALALEEMLRASMRRRAS